MTMTSLYPYPSVLDHAVYALRGRAGSSHKLGRAVALAKSFCDLEIKISSSQEL